MGWFEVFWDEYVVNFWCDIGNDCLWVGVIVFLLFCFNGNWFLFVWIIVVL